MFFLLLLLLSSSSSSLRSPPLLAPRGSGSRFSSSPRLPPQRVSLPPSWRPVVGRRFGGDLTKRAGVLDDVRGGRSLRRHLSVGGVSIRVEVQVQVLVRDGSGGAGLQTEALLRGLTQRSRVQFPEQTNALNHIMNFSPSVKV